MTSGRAALCAAALLGAGLALAEDAPAEREPWYERAKLSGLLYGDAFWFADDHDPSFDDETGFWIRRIYLTYDQELDESWSFRLRLEFNSPGDFESSERLEPFLKDAFVAWAEGAHTLQLGLAPTPTFALIESTWGYRSVEKTPLDLYRWGASRDLGVAAFGTLGEHKKVAYHVQLGNGSDGSETNQGKKSMAALQYFPAEGWIVEVYGDYEDRPDDSDRATAQVFAAWQGQRGRWGIQYARQERESEPEDLSLDLASAFGALELSPRTWLLGRVDRSFDPHPEGDEIPYLPLDPTASSWLYLAGLDWRVNPHLDVIPNFEIVSYDERPDGSRPTTDVVLRVTLDAHF